MKSLTEKQQKILDYIHEYTTLNSCPPTIREIAGHFDISLKAIQDHIAALRKKGHLWILHKLINYVVGLPL